MAATVTGTATINFNANGGSGAPATIQRNYSAIPPESVTVTLPSGKPTRSGYTFVGWSKSSSATSATYHAGGNFTFLSNANTPDPSFTLYAVWQRALSTISASDGTLGTAQTLTVNRSLSSYTHTIEYTFGSVSGTIVSQSSNTSISWTPPVSLASQIPNSASGTCTLKCTTYNGSTSLGYTTKTITLSVPDTIKLKIGTVSITDPVSYVSSRFDGYVQSKSKMQFEITVDDTDAHGATMQTCNTAVNGENRSGLSFTTSNIINSGTVSYTITLTDTRGKTDTYTGSISVYPYSAPSISISSAERDSTTLTSGNLAFSWDISPIGNNQNSKRYRVKYKKATDSSYTQATSVEPSAYSGSSTYTLSNLLSTETYDVLMEASDAFLTSTFTVQIAPAGSRYIECDKQNKSVNFPTGTIKVGETALTEADLLRLLALLS